MSALPTPAEYQEDLCKLHFASSRLRKRPILPDDLITHVSICFADFYKKNFQGKTSDSYKTYLRVSLDALNAFRDALPAPMLQPRASSLFIEAKTLDLRDAHRALGRVFKASVDQLRGIIDGSDRYPLHYLDFDEPMPRFHELEPRFDEPEPHFSQDEPLDSDDKVYWRNNRRYFESHELAYWKERKREFEATKIPAWKQRKRDFEENELARWKERKSQYEKLQKQNQRPPDEEAFIGTPFYDMWLMLKPEISLQLPFSIPPQLRFGHQFLVGASRSGKTTFLTAQLSGDLDRVARGECSVIVMDSQNEFVPNISKLKVFAMGQPLEGKLIYLEASKYPIAANIFNFGRTAHVEDRQQFFRSAFDSVEFFLNSIFKAETSAFQTTMLKYLIQALVAISGATLATLQELMEESGYQKYQSHFHNLDPTVQRWISERLYSRDFTVTRMAVRARLDGLLADPFFRAMFATPDNKLDLFEELQGPKVILINTAELGGVLEPFGRYFISKLDEAILKRKSVPNSSKLPVYCYIDEASDYIADEPLVARIIDKLGKQKLGMIISAQRKAQITSPTVLDALEHVPIQCWTLTPPLVNISLDRAEPVEVTVPLIDLEKLPRVSQLEHDRLRAVMRSRYGADPVQETHRLPTAKPEIAKPKPMPPFDDTDAKPW